MGAVAGGVEGIRIAAPAGQGGELWQPATQVVFSSGPPGASVVGGPAHPRG